MKQKVACFLFFIGGLMATKAQVSQPFSIRYQSFVKGDMTLIANSIVNRKDYTESPNDPYNTLDKSSRNNDEFVMEYIDVDDDNTTFSSSSANLIFAEKPRKIVFAGLYWSATYKYEAGKQNKRNKFVATNKNRTPINQIKIKLPNQSSYQNIQGTVLYDGYDKEGFSESAPYAVFADVTSLLQPLSNPSGTYTVANIKATQGTLSGGVSGGWTLVVVFENDPENGKFITLYDGFAGITSKSTDIAFNGFQALPEGKVKATIYGSALEGDLKLKGDQLLFKSQEDPSFIALENTIREGNNFFNSSITFNDTHFTQRNPNSLNTLGYDAFEAEIVNPDNSVIANNTRSATLRLKSSGDRYFMFMCALAIEVSQPVDRIEMPVTAVAATTPHQQAVAAPQSIEGPVAARQEVPEPVAAAKQPAPKISPAALKKPVNTTSARIQPIESPSVAIAEQPQGYYLVANVFAVHANAVRFVAHLKRKGIEARYFINAKNNYRYVYLAHKDNWKEAEALYFSNIHNTYTDALWIMTINQPVAVVNLEHKFSGKTLKKETAGHRLQQVAIALPAYYYFIKRKQDNKA